MAKIVLDTVTGGYDLSVINNNFDKIETELQNKVLYRNNPVGEPNTLETDVDANGKRIYNLPEPLLDSEPARLQDLQNAVAGAAANLITFTPYGHVAGNNVQAAVQELIDDTTNNGVALPAFLKDSNTIVVDNISALKAIDKTKFTKAQVLGYYTKGDGGGGVYWFDPSDTASADNGGTIIVATDGARWKLAQAGNVTVRQFGAKGDGVTNDAPAIQAAINYVASAPGGEPGKLVVPPGNYVIGASLTISGSLEIDGAGHLQEGAVFVATAALDAPILDVSVRSKISNLTIQAWANAARTNQSGIRIRNTNDVSMSGISFINSYVNLLLDGAVACFYIDVTRCTFMGCVLANIKIDNSSAPGVDLIMSDTRFLGNLGEYCLNFQNGLGSVLATNLQISGTGGGANNTLAYFGIPASGYGGAQFTNCVFENGAGATSTSVFLAGAPATPWKDVWFMNCILNGATGQALKLAHIESAYFIGCGFSSTNATGIIELTEGANKQNVMMTNCNWDGTGAGNAIWGLGSVFTLDLSIVNPEWDGAGPFINLPNLPAANILLSVLGGGVGSNATPISLNNYTRTKKNIATNGAHQGQIGRVVITGTTDGAGVATVNHGIDGVDRIVGAFAYTKGGSGEMLPATINYIDGGAIRITGGATKSYRIVVLHSSTPFSGW